MVSRVAKNPVHLPKGVEVKINGKQLSVKGKKGELHHHVHDLVDLIEQDGALVVSANQSDNKSNALAGTTRALVNNMVIGVNDGFEKKLVLVGVGYRAKAQGTMLNLAVGFSHPVDMQMPEGVSVETPTQTEILLKGANKQLVNQVAANIRAVRAPEPYKGKGIRYVDEVIILKEAKKK